MKTAFEKIAYFNMLIGNSNDTELSGLRAQFECIKEEFEELKTALIHMEQIKAGDYTPEELGGIGYDPMIAMRDGIADVLVTVYGLAHRAGINADADLELVYASNMSKFIHGDQKAAVDAGVEIYQRTGLLWREDETAPGVWAITSAKDQTAYGKFYPAGKLLKPASYVEPIFGPQDGAGAEREILETDAEKCGDTYAPPGWTCTRQAGHQGPCTGTQDIGHKQGEE